MSPDPKALMAASARDALPSNQGLQRKSMKATLAVQATATVACFNILIRAISIRENRR
jgi:hypothetical protein